MFTTRSGRPAWDWIPPQNLFSMVLTPAPDVPDFLPRDPLAQLVLPWTAAEEAEFAPRLSVTERQLKKLQRRQRTEQKSKPQPLSDVDFDLS